MRWAPARPARAKISGLTAARSRHAGGVQILLCDGSARFVGNSIDMTIWQGLATKSGYEFIGDY